MQDQEAFIKKEGQKEDPEGEGEKQSGDGEEFDPEPE